MERIKGAFAKARNEFRRIVAFLLSVVLIVTNCQTTAFAATDTYSEYLDGWYVQTSWSTFSNDYTWNATTDQRRQPKIMVTYRLTNAKHDYPAGSLIFTVPGIGNANRDGVVKASELAADKDDSEWEYKWDKESDVYTFTNKFEVKAGESQSGGFELMWSLSARSCEDGFTQSASPTFTVTNAEDSEGNESAQTITMEPLTYSFTSVRDTYYLSLPDGGASHLAAENSSTYDSNYVWYNFRTLFSSSYKARGLYKSNYFISFHLPDDVEFSEGDIVAYYGGKKYTVEEVDGEYGFYPFKENRSDNLTYSLSETVYNYEGDKDWGTSSTQYGICNVILGFKESVYEGKGITVHGHLDRLYKDESEWTTTAGDGENVDVEATVNIQKYSFNYSGWIYSHHKWSSSYETDYSYRDRNGYYYYDGHYEPSRYVNRLPATSIYSGKIVEFNLYGRYMQKFSEASAASMLTSLRTRLAANKIASSSDLERENDEVLQSISDWDDINWNENGLVDLSAEELGELDGASYSELHPEDSSTISITEVDETVAETPAAVTEATTEEVTTASGESSTDTGSGSGSSASTEASSESSTEEVTTTESKETESKDSTDTTSSSTKEGSTEAESTEKETSVDTSKDTGASNDTTVEKEEKSDTENTTEKEASAEKSDSTSEKTDTASNDSDDSKDTATEKTSALSSLLRKTASIFSITAMAAEKATGSDIDVNTISLADLTEDEASTASTTSVKGNKYSDDYTSGAGNTSGTSKIGEDGEYALVMGDDKLAITTYNGIRNLEDDEYDISYVTVPSYGNYDYEIYGADAQDTAFGDYTFISDGNTSEGKTTQLPSGVKAVFIRVNGIKGSYAYYARIGVRLHLDWETEQSKDASEQVDPEGRVINFSYLRSLYKDPDADNAEINDCAQTSGNYEGSYGEALGGRDLETYNEYLVRDSSNVYLRNPTTVLNAGAGISSFSGNTMAGFTTTISSSGSIQADTAGTITSFSLYTRVPDALTVNIEELGATITGSATTLDGVSLTDEDFQNNATVYEKYINGEHYIVTDFGFEDTPLDALKLISARISFSAGISYAEYLDHSEKYGDTYSVTGYIMPHDEGLSKLSAGSSSYLTTDTNDLDENGNTNDKMAYYSTYTNVNDSAIEWREYASKLVKSEYTESGTYGTEAVTRIYNEADSDAYKKKSNYTYRLEFGLGASNAKDLIFYDHLEQGATISERGDGTDTKKTIDSAWQGTFVSVDTSKAERMGMTATIYYSTDPEQEENIEASGWTTEAPSDLSTVKSIAVRLNTDGMTDHVMKLKNMVYVLVNMRAPTDNSLVGKKAVNQYSISYIPCNTVTGEEQKDTEGNIVVSSLISAETYVSLLSNVGTLTIQKVDGDRVISTDKDGTKKYGNLTGAKIQIYDKDKKALLEDGGREVNSFGRITINDIKPGEIYYWEETKAPAGFEKLSGLHEFTPIDVNATVTIKNHRMPGSVTLTKQDADNNSYGPLAGAEFSLYKSDGTQIFTDKDYRYTTTEDADGNVTVTGTNSTFTTGADGTLTVTNLPWGSYYFLETKAPTGYELNTSKVTFTIDKNAYDEAADTVHVDVDAKDYESTASIELKKTDAENGKAVKDAKFSLYKEGTTDPVRTNLSTNAAGELLVDGLKYGTYYFVETASAPGYVLPASEEERKTASVTLDSSTVGEILKLTKTNDRKTGTVLLTKKDDEGYYVAGAVYKLFYKGENDAAYTGLTETYTTDSEGEIRVSDLKWGDYYFVEYKAPKGYEVSSEHVEFSINLKTCQSEVLIDTVDNRAKGTVKLIKVDKDEKTKTLPGATYELYKSDGTKCVLGTDYTVAEDATSITTGDDGTVTIGNLMQGAYYLKETVAPTSYTLSDELIRFSVTKDNAATVQELTAEDEAGKAVLKINKKINEAYKPFGEPTFIFKVVSDEGKTYEKSITLNDSETSGSVTLSVKKGHTYKVTEISTSRYNLTNVEGVTNVTVTDEEATADLVDNDNAEVTFTNEIKQYEKFSHVTNATNIVKSSTQFTALTLEYTWNDPITKADSETDASGNVVAGYDEEDEVFIIPKSKLIVTAFYDDGTSKVIDADDYTLLNDTFDGTQNGAQNLEVVYTENGTTRKATYPVTINLPIPVKHMATFDLQGGSITLKNTDGTTSVVTENQNGGKYKEGTSVSLPSNFSGDPTKKGYTFLGWVTEEGITTDTAYNALSDSEKWFRTTNSSGTISDKSTKPAMGAGDVTYYAAWTLSFDVKYAVSIYGIEQDSYEGGGDDKAGLTFGPATGASYVSSYHSHTPSGQTTSGNNHRCIHNDEWETIIKWSKEDPYVYEQCIKEGCTHSVLLNLSTKLKNSSYKSMTGDGTNYLYNSIKSYYRVFNHEKSSSYDTSEYRYNYGSNEGGWVDSAIRNTLNGTVTDNMKTKTNAPGSGNDMFNADGTNNKALTESESLISAFPEELQNAIVAKAVKSDTIFYDAVNGNETTYDKLWLFSGNELYKDTSGYRTSGTFTAHFGNTSKSGCSYVGFGSSWYSIRQNEGTLYQRQEQMGITTSNYSKMKGYYENGSSASGWWLRSPYFYNSNYVYDVNGGSGYSGYNSAYIAYALAPGFSVK